MNKKIFALFVVFTTLMVTSCVKDLDVKPIDPRLISSGNLSDIPDASKRALAKIYAAFNMPGQSDGDNDLTTADANFTTFIRALWNCQELTTDEVICAWGDAGIADFNTQTWTPNNPFLTGVYARVVYISTLSNDLIRLTEGATDAETVKINAEARFLRALAYSYAIDLFGSPAFTTKEDKVGSFFPNQIKRKDLFYHLVTELKSIENVVGGYKWEFGRADKGAVQMLLARLYLNAEVYTADPITQKGGTAKYDSCKIYCDKVIASGKYSLASNYRQNFSSDNDVSPEMIFSINADGINSVGYAGVTFIMHSSIENTWVKADELNLGTEGGWGGNRTKKEFVNVLVDTLATYGGASVASVKDVYFAMCKDKRVFIKTMGQWDITAPSKFEQGIGVYKFTNSRSDGKPIVNYNNTFESTDFPIFRLADAYLMRAESALRLGDRATALADVNKVRERAFGNTSYNVTDAKLSLQYILDERGREFYYEAQRRTDLVRFGQFTDGTYTWSWKGNDRKGVKTSKHLNLFPIPGDETAANLNIKQNYGY